MASWAAARPPSPITTAPSESASARCRPTMRANEGASAPKTANASTGSEVSRPASAPLRPSPWRTSSSTGPTLTAAGTQVEREEDQAHQHERGTTDGGHRAIVSSGSAGPSHRRTGAWGWPGAGCTRAALRRRRTTGAARASATVWPYPVADTAAATRATVCLHATEPASVHLAAWARVRGHARRGRRGALRRPLGGEAARDAADRLRLPPRAPPRDLGQRQRPRRRPAGPPPGHRDGGRGRHPRRRRLGRGAPRPGAAA